MLIGPRRQFFAPILALLSCALLPGCESKEAPPAPEIRPVRSIVADPRSEGELISVTGHIRARTEKSLAFRIDGRMIARKVDVGDVLRVDDLVAELDPQPQRDALRAAQAKLAASQAVLAEASNNWDRQKNLLQQGWTNRVQYDAVDKVFKAATADVQANSAQSHASEDMLGYTRLLADAAGVVTAKGAEPGEVVRAGQMILTVAQDNGLDAVFDVPSSILRQVAHDAPISIALTDDPSIQIVGKVREVAPQADPVTQSFRVKVALTDVPSAMHLGSTVTGKTRMQAANGIELPATALTVSGDKPAVWVVDPETQQVSLRIIEVARQGSSSIVVSDGLKAGERVVTAGVHALRPGQKVRAEGVNP
ncbi:MAG: efflux RND transporter periplasmic adaptor subunit [Rhodomicrobium sp.]